MLVVKFFDDNILGRLEDELQKYIDDNQIDREEIEKIYFNRTVIPSLDPLNSNHDIRNAVLLVYDDGMNEQ